MDAPFYACSSNNINSTINDKMNSSLNSTLEDTTPSDSGVQLLDSEAETSELMAESITSQTGFDFETIPNTQETVTVALDSNFNVTPSQIKVEPIVAEETMTASGCSTFDTTENIVYRRKVRKPNSGNKTPKKRVSFHEDILKNTRTDNIHIEHGFVTYKNGRKLYTQPVAGGGRYSWCSEREARGLKAAPTSLCATDENNEQLDNETTKSAKRRVVYRNACSDVLDYGNCDIYDTNESNVLQYDNSGVFEYTPKENNQELYKCSNSDSDSSLDSEEQENNANYTTQSKSSSCDCIGTNNASNNNFIDENCYFSEPNMQSLTEDHTRKKSVWNKETKPKSSCLKKTKYNTYIIQEQDVSKSVKKFNVHNVNQLLDNSSKIIIGSLKSLFIMPLPERGVPEGSEDLHSVVECIPESTPEHKANVNLFPNSPTLKSKPFLSKSLDGSKQAAGIKNFVHNVDEQLRRKNEEEIFAASRENSAEQESSNAAALPKMLQRQEELMEEETYPQKENANVFRNKFIINCESTVFEHTGVSYSFETAGDVQTYNALLNEQQTVDDNDLSLSADIEKPKPVADSVYTIGDSFIGAPIAKTFSKFLKSFKTLSPTDSKVNESEPQIDEYFAGFKIQQKAQSLSDSKQTFPKQHQQQKQQQQEDEQQTKCNVSSSLILATDLRSNMEKSRHLPSPLKKRHSNSNLVNPQRYGHMSNGSIATSSGVGLGSELSSNYNGARDGCGRDSKSTILSEEFDDDMITITTDADKNESDIVIVDYTECNEGAIITTTTTTKTTTTNTIVVS